MNLKTGQFMLVNGNSDYVMAEENNIGQMVHTTKGIGKTTWQMEKAVYSMLTEMFMKGNGRMIKLMVKVFILMLMGLNIAEIGMTINKKDREQKPGPMELST